MDEMFRIIKEYKTNVNIEQLFSVAFGTFTFGKDLIKLL